MASIRSIPLAISNQNLCICVAVVFLLAFGIKNGTRSDKKLDTHIYTVSVRFIWTQRQYLFDLTVLFYLLLDIQFTMSFAAHNLYTTYNMQVLIEGDGEAEGRKRVSVRQRKCVSLWRALWRQREWTQMYTHSIESAVCC